MEKIIVTGDRVREHKIMVLESFIICAITQSLQDHQQFVTFVRHPGSHLITVVLVYVPGTYAP